MIKGFQADGMPVWAIKKHTFTVTLDTSASNPVAVASLGGIIQSTGFVGGQYLMTYTTVVTVAAIANVVVTTTGSTITITNNNAAGHTFDGKILVRY